MPIALPTTHSHNEKRDTMTVKEMSSLVGEFATYWVKEMEFEVTIIDARTRYGNVDVKIVPVSGNGATWVSLSSVKITH
jgi:hypothetical protein